MKINRNIVLFGSIIIGVVILSIWVLTQPQSSLNVKYEDTDFSFTRIDLYPAPDWNTTDVNYYLPEVEGVLINFHVQLFDLFYEDVSYVISAYLNYPSTLIKEESYSPTSSSNTFGTKYYMVRDTETDFTFSLFIGSTIGGRSASYEVTVVFSELTEVPITEEETTTTTIAPEVVEEVTPFYFSLIPIIVIALKGKRGRMNKND